MNVIPRLNKQQDRFGKMNETFFLKWPKVKNSGTNARTTQKYIHTTMDHLTKDDRESAKTEEKHEQRREV